MIKSVHTLVITNLPSFYKLNLYNLIAEKQKLLVLFTDDHAADRNADFFKGDKNFGYQFLSGNSWNKVKQLLHILRNTKYEELQLGGWDSIFLWVASMVSPKRKNAVVVESSIWESATTGLKGLIKRVFIGRVSKVYASGKSQQKLTDALGFKGKTVITKGVGVFNYIPQPPYQARESVKKFIYVGRLTAVKNLHFLIDTFNELPHLSLTIVGFGEQEDELKQLAGDNITFLGAIDNKKLPQIYQQHDVFILPSYIEPWGLVVEEALNNGLPVMVSDKVGCAEEIIENGVNGLIFKCSDKTDLIAKISRIENVELYNAMRQAISKLNFAEIEQYQVECYL